MPELTLCEWCRRRRVERRGARYCSHACRQRAFESRQRTARLLADLREANRHTREALQRLREILENRHAISPGTQRDDLE